MPKNKSLNSLRHIVFKNKKFKNKKPKDKKLIAKYCGHVTKQSGKVTAFGESIKTEMRLKEGTVYYCLDCIGKMAIRCTWCGETIFIGDPVTLFSTDDPNYQPPEYAVLNGREFVGCLGENCADTGADRAGLWLPDTDSNTGHVVRTRSMYSIAATDGFAISGD